MERITSLWFLSIFGPNLLMENKKPFWAHFGGFGAISPGNIVSLL